MDFKDIGVRKPEFVAKTQFLSNDFGFLVVLFLGCSVYFSNMFIADPTLQCLFSFQIIGTIFTLEAM